EVRGRIQAFVPDVLGLIPSTFALPCVPVAGKSSGAFFVPEIGAGVWIEFEQGDPDYPIWTGCFWGITAEVPLMGVASPPPTPNMVLETTGKNSLTIFGLPAAGVALSAGPLGPSPSITVTPVGIVIKCGASVISVSPAGVDIVGPKITLNGTALVVT
ncbi:MAG TPA: phage baseplate assembly protein V, partial [Tahibacter sp.]|nr:phage baseplate assembly protein V [Tahibacter sp.]